jgi:hypothetical protein
LTAAPALRDISIHLNRGVEMTAFKNHGMGFLRALAGVFLLALALAGCGGGGGGDPGGDGNISPTQPPLSGNWTLVLTVDGQASPATAVPGSSVPTAEMVAQISTASLAQQLASSGTFEGFTVTVNAGTIRVTGPGTDYTLTITSLSASGYQGCGGCGVGSLVSFNVNAAYSESGTIDGQTVPPTSGTVAINFRFSRQS